MIAPRFSWRTPNCVPASRHAKLKATPLREEKPAGGKPGRAKLAAHLPRVEIRHE
jgi:hypothetical protein